ncbi:hypothetical protein Z051_26645 [Rhodococcus rhodochrous KG-21]|uniref:Uncharacterized protein n=1 Tax=Rhodococcus rhodochrous KG-21 TaxID=1441923 RepID=A0A0M9WLA6_RHORH|nr:hypothetical protein Z051_26645 [Rhodococcus rhodochrous KG-21]
MAQNHRRPPDSRLRSDAGGEHRRRGGWSARPRSQCAARPDAPPAPSMVDDIRRRPSGDRREAATGGPGCLPGDLSDSRGRLLHQQRGP